MTRTEFQWSTDMQVGAFYADDVTLHFDVDLERVEREPYSHGGSRGFYTEARATFRCLMLDHLMVDRALLVQIVGSAEVAGLEERASEAFEEYEAAA